MLEPRRHLPKRVEDGASAVEYGLLVAGIALLIVLTVFALGSVFKDVFVETCSTVASKTPSVTATC